jgi:predicted GNAT family acetyltransferase
VCGLVSGESPPADGWLLDNTQTVEFAVVRSHRRRGVATRLLDAVIERARAEGRRVLSGFDLTGDPVTGESAGTAFAAARGFARKHAELHQVLELPVPAEQLVPPWSSPRHRRQGTQPARAPGGLHPAGRGAHVERP